MAAAWFIPLGEPILTSEQGSVRLLDLPAAAHIYVDGKPVPSHNGLLRLPPGWHAIQVEALQVNIKLPQWNGVAAYWRMAPVLAHQTCTLRITLYPVRPPAIYDGQIVMLIPGPPGPPGPPGDAGSAQNAAVDNPSQMLRLALDLLIDDLSAQEQDVENQMNAYLPTYGFYYVPPHDAYQVLAGPAGPPGLEGASGLPPGILLLRDEKGQLLFEEMKTRLGLRQIEEKLAYLKPRVADPPWPRPKTLPYGIVLLTPEFRAAFDEAIKNALAAPIPPHDHPDDFALGTPMGSPGARGPKGPDATSPAGTPAVRLSAEQTRQLLKQFANDKDLQKQIADLRNKVDDLALWIGEDTSLPSHK